MSLGIEEAWNICTDLLQIEVERIEFPGGSSRDAVRVCIDRQSLFVIKRKSNRRAQLEIAVLRLLNQNAGPAPHLIAFRDNYLIQQDVGSRRLSERLHDCNERQAVELLGAALSQLAVVHGIGKSDARFDAVVTLGCTEQWRTAMVKSVERLSERLEIPAPHLDIARLVQLLQVDNPCFIKWDARPGNAVVSAAGEVVWIDWEHCGRRHPLDDMAWLLTDEYTPYFPQSESALISRVLPVFANGYSLEHAHEYLRVFGTFHSCIRIAMILNHQSKGGWWDFQRCLELDRVGVVRDLAIQSCKRAAHWSSHSKLTESLTPWFSEVLRCIEQR